MAYVELSYLPLNIHGFDLDLERAVRVLDDHETARYQRFKNAHAQSCFLQARRMVKRQLAEKLHCAEADVVFAYSDTEKPYLKDTSHWHFNISHSKNAIVVALAEQAVGVDVEDISRCLKVWQKAGDFINSHAKHYVDRAKTEKQAAAIFAEHWCCVESYVKLKGSAIYREKDRVKAGAHSNFLKGKRMTFEETTFTVLTFNPEIRIALAIEHDFPEVKLIHWRTDKTEVIV